MDDSNKPVIGNWVMVLSMRDGRNPSLIHTPQEILVVTRTWSVMRVNRNEPRPASLNGFISDATGSGDTFILHGVSGHDFDTTKQMFDELGICMGSAFNLEIIEVVIGEQRFNLTKKATTPSSQ